mmetsp:Transcript_51089/g.76314  ORF Transcript_51089/g.76314 Transcript_51089/m.76314 type:complete len:109 (+) Transcript_51089:397-723(+)
MIMVQPCMGILFQVSQILWLIFGVYESWWLLAWLLIQAIAICLLLLDHPYPLSPIVGTMRTRFCSTTLGYSGPYFGDRRSTMSRATSSSMVGSNMIPLRFVSKAKLFL